MRVVGFTIRIQILLHLLDGLVPGRAALDPEMFLEEGCGGIAR